MRAAAVLVVAGVLLVAGSLAGCASLNLAGAVQAPTVSNVENRDSELRVLSPSSERPVGAASVRLWSRIGNPNAFSLTITRLAGDLFLGDAGSVTVDFPLGVPLVANGDTLVPLDVIVGFDALPALGRTLVAGALEGELGYRLQATIGVDAGVLGQPTFGPLTALSGTLRVRR